jgi:thiol:disulfide interchange protein DsbD
MVTHERIFTRKPSNLVTYRHLTTSIIASFVLALLLQFPHPAHSQVYNNVTLVKFDLLTDRKATAAGDTFLAGIKFKLEPGWHIYWENSGDAGFPTTVDWMLPEGVTTGPLQWETPAKFEEAGGIITYGYSNEVVLWNEIRVSDDFEGDSLPLEAKMTWLVCKELCIPGDGEIKGSIAVRDAAEPKENKSLERVTTHQAPKLVLRDLPGVGVTYYEPDNDNAYYGGIEFSFVPEMIAAKLDKAQFKPLTKYDQLYFFARANGPVFTERVVSLDGGRRWVIPFGEELPRQEGIISGILTIPVTNADGDDQLAAVDLAFDLAKLDADMASATADAASVATGATASGTFSLDSSDFKQSGLAGVQDKSILYLIVLAFLGGLILNVMPCVLPVLSVKVFSLVKQSGESRGRMLALGTAYTLGVWVSLMVLAGLIVILGQLGTEVGWAFQFQSPYFNYVILVIITVFSLSLFGVFEIILPGSIQDGAQSAAQREGLPGAFLGGVFSTVLATPCMAPILAPVLSYALTLHLAQMIILFSAIALGLASPFLGLSFNPSLIKAMPKPGNWMITFKQFMGLMMLGAAIFPLYVLISMAEQADVIAASMILVLGTTMFLLAVLSMMVGKLGGMAASRGRRLIVQTFAVVAFLSFHFWVADPKLSQLAAPKPDIAQRASIVQAGAASVALGSSPAKKGGPIAWVDFSQAELERRLNRGENVFIDFTAAWCITCKVNEKNVLNTSTIAGHLNSDYLTPMIADWTFRDDEIGNMLAKFGRVGVPFYVLFRADDPGNPVVFPELLTTDLLLEEFLPLIPETAG